MAIANDENLYMFYVVSDNCMTVVSSIEQKTLITAKVAWKLSVTGIHILTLVMKTLECEWFGLVIHKIAGQWDIFPLELKVKYVHQSTQRFRNYFDLNTFRDTYCGK